MSAHPQAVHAQTPHPLPEPSQTPHPHRERIRVLLTGMSGTGKSTLVHRLRDLGHRAVDLDDGCTTESIGLPGEVLWLEERVRDLLDGPEEVLFVAGCASNQGAFREDFDQIVLLSAPPDVIRERLATREGNPFGKTPEQATRVLADQAEVEPLLRRVADHEIVTTGEVEQSVEQVLAVLGACETSTKMRDGRTKPPSKLGGS